ncbi:hypothetical protein Tco_0899811 [Tanacetum coccineum]
MFHSNKTPQVSSIFAITSTLPSIEPKDSLIMGDEHLSTFSAEEIVPIPRESEDTSESESENVLPLCDDLSSFNVPRDDSMTFSNSLFEFDVNFNSITPLSDSNKDECLTPGDDIEFLLHHDPSTPLKSVASILEGFINEPPFEENDDLFDLESIEGPTYIEEGIVREHKDYINRMSLLCGNSSSRSPENSHTIIESLPTSTTLVEDSDSNREEIDIFSGPDNSIPPGIKSDLDSEEDIIDNFLNDDPIHERLTFIMEPDEPVINNVDEFNEDEYF